MQLRYITPLNLSVMRELSTHSPIFQIKKLRLKEKKGQNSARDASIVILYNSNKRPMLSRVLGIVLGTSHVFTYLVSLFPLGHMKKPRSRKISNVIAESVSLKLVQVLSFQSSSP